MDKKVLVRVAIRSGELVLQRILSQFDGETVNHVLKEVWHPVNENGIVTHFVSGEKMVRNGSLMMYEHLTKTLKNLNSEEQTFIEKHR